MKVVITLEDHEGGIYPIIQWDGNGITDHLHQSLSMNLAAQFAEMLKKYSTLGIIKVVDPRKKMH